MGGPSRVAADVEDHGQLQVIARRIFYEGNKGRAASEIRLMGAAHQLAVNLCDVVLKTIPTARRIVSYGPQLKPSIF